LARPAPVRQRPARSLGRSAIDTAVFLIALTLVVAVLKLSGVLTIDDGPVKVLDGDSLRRGDADIRLAGIDAPEYQQMCQEKSGEGWACGRMAMRELRKLIGGRDVACTAIETDQYGRLLAHCSAGTTNLNDEMVRSGFAVSYDGIAYVRSEAEARTAKRGLWRGTFERPKTWRERNRAIRGDARALPAAPED
jgi:endonuclease YncB( thermonuclease family)